MKSLFRLPNLLILAVAVFAFTACSDDPEFQIPPSVSFSSETGFLDFDATLAAGSPIKVKIEASKGDNPMKSIEFQEDGARISDITRITIDGAAASSAAELLFDGEKDAFTKEIEITPHADGAADYTFLVSDDGGEVSSVTLTITIESEPPTLEAKEGLYEISADADGFAGITLIGTPSGSGALLTTVSVYEGGSLVAGADRLLFGTTAFEGSYDLTGTTDEDGFEVSLAIKANATSGVTDTYTVEITDANGLTAERVITVTSKVTTPLEKSLSGILLNQSGPMGTGGLDLDDGIGTGSMDAIAEIRDQGSDFSLPDATNWRQQIAGVNGSVLKYIDPSTLPDSFVFLDVDNKEAITALYDANTEITGASAVVLQGDIFAVSNNGKTYLLEVVDVKVTDGDNEDSYTFNIKY